MLVMRVFINVFTIESNRVILMKKAQDGFGIFWKKKKFSYSFFTQKVYIVFPNVVYIFSQYRSAEF